jgi:predicted esterase
MLRTAFCLLSIGSAVLGGGAYLPGAPGRVVDAPAVPVAFLAHAPAIDGALDAGLEALVVRPLSLVSGPPEAAARPPSYRLAYSAEHLYLHVDLGPGEIVQRDRAYQNGDGLIVVVARPAPGGAPTEEFSVLGFSPGKPAAAWQQRFVWYRNVDLEMRGLDAARVATSSSAARSAFEVLVPWSEVYPHHPWLSAVGFNLCVTRALPGNGAARYCAVDDSRVDSEQNPRDYKQLAFEPPEANGVPQAAAVLERNHSLAGEAIRLRLATLAASPVPASLTLRAWSGEGTRVLSRVVNVTLPAGLQRQDVELPAGTLPPGGYAVTWELSNAAQSGRLGLSVLPATDAASLERRLDAAGRRISSGSLTTLRFELAELGRAQERLRPQDVATSVRVSLERLVGDVRAAEAGEDAVAARTGILRRAFRSAVDGTLQPYSVRLPAGHRAGRRYPLFVYLHGSGEDDRNQVGRDWFPADAIVLAPRGRGTSNFYTADHAQEDIREAIEDVVANYSVDTTRVVLAGFSMGGYGVYRTYKEDPTRYRALAIFSGIPRVPAGSQADAPDFLAQEDPALFRAIPMFVFHGGKDRNCPIEQTRTLVARLKGAGVKLAFHYEDDKGHETPGPPTLDAFRQWLGAVLE